MKQTQKRPLKAVILAGGLGTRLKPFTDIIPKPLLPIYGEKTVLEIQIATLKKYGFNEIYIATNYRADLVETYLGDGAKYGVQLIFSKEKKPLGTCGPLWLLKDQLKEPFLMMNGDILTDLHFAKFADFSLEHGCLLTVLTKEVVTPFAFGNVIVKNEKIVHIEEKPDVRFIIIGGVYFFQPDIFKHIPEDQYFGIDTLMKKLLKQNIPIASYFTNEYWVDIGRMDDLHEVRERYTKQVSLTTGCEDEFTE